MKNRFLRFPVESPDCRSTGEVITELSCCTGERCHGRAPLVGFSTNGTTVPVLLCEILLCLRHDTKNVYVGMWCTYTEQCSWCVLQEHLLQLQLQLQPCSFHAQKLHSCSFLLLPSYHVVLVFSSNMLDNICR
jgi:hypothetical protein